MVNNSTPNPNTNNNSPSTSTKTSGNKLPSFTRRLQNIYHLVWSVVGIVVLILLLVAVMGGDSWSENLNLTPEETAETAGAQDEAQDQQTSNPAQPEQPTQEQLDCVASEVGGQRFLELQQGAQPDQDEAATIQECLSS